ncbi:unnamed protein product [Arctogadus glacialis]
MGSCNICYLWLRPLLEGWVGVGVGVCVCVCVYIPTSLSRSSLVPPPCNDPRLIYWTLQSIRLSGVKKANLFLPIFLSIYLSTFMSPSCSFSFPPPPPSCSASFFL